MRTRLATLALLLCAGVAAPAHAAQTTVRDRTGDVQQSRVDEDSVFVLQSGIKEGDFVSTTFRHGPTNVVVTSRFRELARVGSYHGFYLRLESGKRVYRDVTVETGPGAWRGMRTVTDRQGHRVRCGVQHSIDYDRNVVRVVVPRACLGKPRLVRGTAAAAWTQPDRDDPSQSDLLQVDNPHSTETDANTWTRWIARD